jgi:hypothetical protein
MKQSSFGPVFWFWVGLLYLSFAMVSSKDLHNTKTQRQKWPVSLKYTDIHTQMHIPKYTDIHTHMRIPEFCDGLVARGVLDPEILELRPQRCH